MPLCVICLRPLVFIENSEQPAPTPSRRGADDRMSMTHSAVTLRLRPQHKGNITQKASARARVQTVSCARPPSLLRCGMVMQCPLLNERLQLHAPIEVTTCPSEAVHPPYTGSRHPYRHHSNTVSSSLLRAASARRAAVAANPQ